MINIQYSLRSYYIFTCVNDKKSKEYVNRSVRMPSELWEIIKRISNRNYRSLNSQFIKITEDWLEDRDFLENNKRTRLDD